MDLNTLPEEMMARIFKRSKYETVINLRKMDSHMDRIAKQYHVGKRLPVAKIRLLITKDFTDREMPICEVNMSLESGIIRSRINELYGEKSDGQLCPRKLTMDYSHSGHLIKFLGKVEVTGCLSLTFGLPINDDFFNTLMNQNDCFQNISELEIDAGWHPLTASKETMGKFLASCPLVQNLTIARDVPKTNFEPIFDSEVLGGRHWENLEMYAEDFIEKDFLYKVIKNCTRFIYRADAQITVNEYVAFIEECFLEKDFLNGREWNFEWLPLNTDSKVDIACKRLEHLGCKVELVKTEREDPMYIDLQVTGENGFKTRFGMENQHDWESDSYVDSDNDSYIDSDTDS